MRASTRFSLVQKRRRLGGAEATTGSVMDVGGSVQAFMASMLSFLGRAASLLSIALLGWASVIRL
jgi:hypothetical protein